MSAKTDPASVHAAVLQRILGCYLSCRSKFDLLVFWRHYPGGWFGQRAVSPLTRTSPKEMRESLDKVVEERVIDCHLDGAMLICVLTRDPTIRRAVEELPKLTQRERDYLLHHSMRQHDVSDDRHDIRPAQT